MDPDAYVGSSKCIKEQVYKHCWITEQEELPQEHSRSFHYRRTRRDGVTSNFRLLAAFNCQIEPGYLLLLEAIFMILLGTYRRPRLFTQYSPKVTYDLVRGITDNLDFQPCHSETMRPGRSGLHCIYLQCTGRKIGRKEGVAEKTQEEDIFKMQR